MSNTLSKRCMFSTKKKKRNFLSHSSMGHKGKYLPSLKESQERFSEVVLSKQILEQICASWFPKEVVWDSWNIHCEASKFLRTGFKSWQGTDHRGFHLPSIYNKFRCYILNHMVLKVFKLENGMVTFYFQVDNAGSSIEDGFHSYTALKSF